MILKTLVLIVPNPPFEPGEEFLNSELPYLAKSFQKIIVIHHSQNFQPKSYPFPIELHYFPYLPTKSDKVSSFKWIFSPVFWSECATLILRYRLFPKPRRIASLLGSLSVGEKLKDFIIQKFYKPDQYQLYAYSYWCNFMAIGLAMLKKQQKEITCISRAHGYDVFFERSCINYLPLRRFVFKNLDCVYFISKKGFEYTSEKVGLFPSMKVSYLGSLGVTLSPKIENPVIQIVSCSASIELKRVHLIIEALSILDIPQKIKWIHFGNGPLFNNLQALAKEKLGSKERIEYEFKGYVPNHEVLDFYSKNTVHWFINVSSTEGLPFSIIEACSAGIPAIATDVGGTREIVIHGKNGFLLSPDLTAVDLKDAFASAFSMKKNTWDIFSDEAYLIWNDQFRADKNFSSFVNDFSSPSL